MIQAVIGANYGDEGKGLAVDYFAAKAPKHTLVVRYNGGAQAGHTVTTPDGLRHVFSHFGSGSAAGADTYLTSDFIVNPMIFRKEWGELHGKGIDPTIYIDSNCRVTLPFDMMVNQVIERERGIRRHGSCGLGVFETVHRSQWAKYRLPYHYLSSPSFLRGALTSYLKEFIWKRINRDAYDKLNEFGDIGEIGQRFIEDCDFMVSKAKIVHGPHILHNYKNVIFEGAQGLLLDQSNKDNAPHLTPSSTGLRNIAQTLHDAELCIDRNFEAVFVTRTYITRHGAGPMPEACNKSDLLDSSVDDKTNGTNEFQGALRYGKLNTASLNKRIHGEIWKYCGEQPIVKIAFTHTNELAMPSKEELRLIDADGFYSSDGETRNSVNKVMS